MERKIYFIIVLSMLVVSSMFGGVVAAEQPQVPRGRSNIAHLYLYEKDPVTWEIIEDGAWGKMKYNHQGSTFDFNFIGHNLVSDVSYTLIYYPDPWPGQGLICLGEALANEDGTVRIKDDINIGSIPIFDDENYREGAKIWLVLSDDIDPVNNHMIGWNPTEYLFENNLIFFFDIDR